jgi:hypothetical protein
VPDIHLRFGGSTATRTLACPAWPNVADLGPDIDRTSPAAARGTMLHDIMEKHYEDGEAIEDLCKDLSEDDRTAIDYALNATEAVLDKYQCSELVCEEMVTMAENIGGSADMIACGDVVLVIDYKFGHAPVTNTDQFSLYALCGIATASTQDMFRNRRVISAIIQPAVSARAIEHEHSQGDLQKFHLAFMTAVKESETGTLAGNPGDHCKYCEGAPYCDAKRSQVAGFVALDKGNSDQLAAGMDLVAQMKAQIRAIEGECFQALEHGIPVTGWKLVLKKGIRHWIDPEAVWHKLRYNNKARKEMYIEEKLRSAPQVTAALKKAKVDLDLDAFISNESTGTTIAPESDKRSAIEIGVVPAALDSIIGKAAGA